MKEVPGALSEGTGTAPPLDIDKAGLKIEPNTAPQDSSSPSVGMLLDVGDETARTALASPTSATTTTYRAAEHSTLGDGASCLTNSTTFDLGSSMMKSAPTEPPISSWNSEWCGTTGKGGVENRLSGMLHGESRAITTKDGGSTDEHGPDLSADNVITSTLYVRMFY